MKPSHCNATSYERCPGWLLQISTEMAAFQYCFPLKSGHFNTNLQYSISTLGLGKWSDAATIMGVWFHPAFDRPVICKHTEGMKGPQSLRIIPGNRVVRHACVLTSPLLYRPPTASLPVGRATLTTTTATTRCYHYYDNW